MNRYLKIAAGAIGAVVIAVVIVVVVVLYRFGAALPDVDQLRDYEPPVTTRIHAADGELVGEYARERRLFVPLAAIPEQVIQAFMAAEDKNFYDHGGIDYLGVIRAVFENVYNKITGHRLVGASTITQQVAKNFLLTNEVSYSRKIKEAILAYRIERAFDKDQILELYLNEIYLGQGMHPQGSYGVAAAAQSYFDKALSELDLAEAAYLAALPKAPSNYHPVRHPRAAKGRRDWVLGRMASDGFITRKERDAAIAEPLQMRAPQRERVFTADYFNEEIRREIAALYGYDALYDGGLSIRSTLDSRLQAIAETALRHGLVTYDRRHGWRGPIRHIELAGWKDQLAALKISTGPREWRLAAVLSVDASGAGIGTIDGDRGTIPFSRMSWARPNMKEQNVGPAPSRPSDVVKPGDVIVVEKVTGEGAGADEYSLQQIPKAEGAIVALDPHTGRILALVGGFDYNASQFDRAMQAARQPGSAFKPFVYAAALDSGFTPSDLVLDAPFVMDQGPGLPKWRPQNYSNEFYGPSTLRMGIEKSRNVMTVRLAQQVGMEKVAAYADKFGITEKMPKVLAMSLGAGETTVLKLTNAYAMLVNGGKRITPSLIDRIQDRWGRTVYRHDKRPCLGCTGVSWSGQPAPVIEDTREQVVEPATAYQMVSMLEGVVQRGTGARVGAIGKPLAGKTGTTNDNFDNWFVGFAPDLAVGAYVGFDNPQTLGSRETGASSAAPIFKEFMENALKDQPAIPFRIPPDIRLVRVNSKTGLPTSPEDRNVILEAFKPGTEPNAHRTVLDGSGVDGSDGGMPLPARSAPVGTGGLY
ncbi:penicillin-binding protein 1A [Emcibacter sp. SYSU 3D8]|uniref:penicillin-binding protein 1A n=1 Tax=Emcibacter sp. SYSU 3D8 TaxID=3133969 RepID=UPI0031FE64C8